MGYAFLWDAEGEFLLAYFYFEMYSNVISILPFLQGIKVGCVFIFKKNNYETL